MSHSNYIVNPLIHFSSTENVAGSTNTYLKVTPLINNLLT